MTRRLPVEKLFFVDDSADEVFITKLLFERQRIDLEIEHFHDFASFHERLKTLSDDELIASLSVMDLNLGVSKGTDGIKELRGSSLGTDLLIGICSGSEDPADILSAQKVRANFFVGKPLDAKSLATICEVVPVLDYLDDDDAIRIERILPPAGE